MGYKKYSVGPSVRRLSDLLEDSGPINVRTHTTYPVKQH